MRVRVGVADGGHQRAGRLVVTLGDLSGTPGRTDCADTAVFAAPGTRHGIGRLVALETVLDLFESGEIELTRGGDDRSGVSPCLTTQLAVSMSLREPRQGNHGALVFEQ